MGAILPSKMLQKQPVFSVFALFLMEI